MAGTTLLLATSAAHAGWSDQLYLDLRGGVSLAQDADVHEDAFGLGNGGKVKFDTGFRASLALGYKITPEFAVELEGGDIRNTINAIGFNSLSPFGASADLNQVPLIASVIYEPWHGAFKPYIGVGAGGVAGIFHGSNFPTEPSFSDTDYVFAYQATVGIKYAVCRHAELGLAYEFLGTTDNNWSDNGVSFKTDGVMTHSFSASLTWRF